MKKRDVALVLGLLPLSYVFLLIVGAGDVHGTLGTVFRESIGDRFIQALLLSVGLGFLIWYFRREKRMDEAPDTIQEAMRFFGKARDAYSAKGMQKEASECDELIAKISHIALDTRIELKL